MRTCTRGFVVTTLLFLVAASALAQKRTYGLDEDPIRLGERALYAGDLNVATARFNEAIAAEYQVDRAILGLARIAVRQGRPQDAEPLFRQAIEERKQQNKGFAEARAGLGLLLLHMDRDAEAELEFEEALKEDDDLWAAKYGKALLLMRRSRWEQAKKLLDEGSKLEGVQQGEDQYHYGLARYHFGIDEVQEAEKHALLALDANPTDPDHGLLVSEIYQRRNSPTLAISAFEKALAAPGMTATAPMLQTLGQLYEDTQQFEEARDRYLAAVQADSLYAPALKSLADLYRRGHRPEQAARVYLRYVLLERNDVDALLGLAESCYEIGQYRQTVEAANSVLQLEPANEEAQFQLARAGIHLRDDDIRQRSADLFAQLPASLSWSARDHAAIAAFEIRRKQFPRAQKALDRGFELDPDSPELHFQQGILDLNTDRVESAIDALEMAAKGQPAFALAHLNLGIAYLKAKRVAEAVEPLQRAVELQPDLLAARLLLAQALAGSERLEEAQQQYERILEESPDNATALRGLGFCAMRRSDFQAAADRYAHATRLDPDNVEGWAGLGNAYLGLQDLTGAEGAFRRASAIDPKHPMTIKGLELLEQYKQAGNE